MAETLREGCSYKLITESGDGTESNEKRQVYFVKLTDSCLKAIEEYTNELRYGLKTKPSIRFDGKNGAVVIPTKSLDKKKFRFGISNVFTSDTNPLQECIKHCNVNSNELKSYGPLAQKISIAATDDSYENTKNRMALVEQDRKDVRTKEIEINMKKGRKAVKPVLVGSKVSAIKNQNVKRSNPHAVNSPKPVASSTNLPHGLPKKSPVSHGSKKSPLNIPPSGEKGFSVRDRVIHILAIRAYKKVELFSRLQKEGMSQKDGSSLSAILQQVASQTDANYALLRELYGKLQVDSWPFYSMTERATVKRNMAAPAPIKHNSPKINQVNHTSPKIHPVNHTSPKIKQVNHTSPQVVSSTSKSPDEKASKRPCTVNTTSNNKRQKTENTEEPSSTSKTPPENNKSKGEESPPIVSSNSDSPEYLSIYKSITSTEQRLKYKSEFQSEYPEYIKLKSSLDAVGIKFIELDKALRSAEKGSSEYFKIQDEIITAYNEQDEKYHAMKRRCQELHEKLSHIKRLVMEYDSNHMVNS